MAQRWFLRVGEPSLTREDLVYVAGIVEERLRKKELPRNVFGNLKRLSDILGREAMDRLSGREKANHDGSPGVFEWSFSMDLGTLNEEELDFFAEFAAAVQRREMPVTFVAGGKEITLLPSRHLTGIFGRLTQFANEELGFVRQEKVGNRLPTFTVGGEPEVDRAARWRDRRQVAREATPPGEEAPPSSDEE